MKISHGIIIGLSACIPFRRLESTKYLIFFTSTLDRLPYLFIPHHQLAASLQPSAVTEAVAISYIDTLIILKLYSMPES